MTTRLNEIGRDLARGKAERTTQMHDVFAAALRRLLDQDDYSWRSVCDDAPFERHVRTFVRKLIRITKDSAGLENTGRYR